MRMLFLVEMRLVLLSSTREDDDDDDVIDGVTEDLPSLLILDLLLLFALAPFRTHSRLTYPEH